MSSTVRERGAHSLLVRETDAHPAPYSIVAPLRLRSAPALLLAACFAAGICCKPWWQPASAQIALCTALFVIACAAWLRAPRLRWLTLGCLWIALGWTAASLQATLADRSLLPYADELQRDVEAEVIALRTLPPRVTVTDTDAATAGLDEEGYTPILRRSATESIDLDVHAIEEVSPAVSTMVQTHGAVRVNLLTLPGAPLPALTCGSRIVVTLRLRPPQRFLDPGVWQYADLLATRGISVESNAFPETIRMRPSGHASWTCRFAAAQHWSAQRLQQVAATAAALHLPALLRLTNADAGMLSAMLFGDRTLLDRALRVTFERTGSFHLFVVAGVHVALLMAGVFYLLSRLRCPQWLAACGALLVTSGYAMLTGFGAPVQRALAMSAIYLLVRLTGRERSALNALGIAVLAMLLFDPSAVKEAGFQMTLLAVVAIAGIAAPLGERTLLPYARALRQVDFVRLDPYMRPRFAQLRVSLRWIGEELQPQRRKPRRVVRTPRLRLLPAAVVRGAILIADAVLVTVVAECVLALPMAIYFHRITPFAAPTNLIALPFVGVLMACAMTTFLASLLHPLVAMLPAAITALLLHTVTGVVGVLGSLRGADLRMPAPLLGMSLLALLCWFAAVALLRIPSARVGRLACLLLPVGFALVLMPRRPSLLRDRLEFTAIDVGQGDSLLVASQGKAMLIDAGGPTGSAAMAQQSSYDIGEEVVSPYLWTRGLRHLDVVVLTHAHSDHIGGMTAVVRNFRPRELWLSVDADTPEFRTLLQQAKTLGTTVRHLHAGDETAWSGTTVRAVSPLATYRSGDQPTNDDSLVLRIAYGKSVVLAEGDAEHASESAMLQQRIGPVTLLKVGHHGSNTSSGADLLHAIHPVAAIISCGLGNRFGHPRMPVLQRLQAEGVRTARTDSMGAVQYRLSADGSIDTHVLASNP